MRYQINEIFYSIQGEGMHMGWPAIFIRMAGCSMGCSFCDTKYSQKVNLKMDENQVFNAIKKYPCRFVVITGGEPLEQDISPLCKWLDAKGYDMAIETNGSRPISKYLATMCHITVSPKKYLSISALPVLDEMKVVIGSKEDVPKAEQLASRIASHIPIYLQAQSNKKKNLKLCIEACLKNPRFRLGVQLHKLIGVR